MAPCMCYVCDACSCMCEKHSVMPNITITVTHLSMPMKALCLRCLLSSCSTSGRSASTLARLACCCCVPGCEPFAACLLLLPVLLLLLPFVMACCWDAGCLLLMSSNAGWLAAGVWVLVESPVAPEQAMHASKLQQVPLIGMEGVAAVPRLVRTFIITILQQRKGSAQPSHGFKNLNTNTCWCALV